MKRVWCVAAICVLLLAAFILMPLCVQQPASVEAVNAGFELLAPSIAFSPISLSFNAIVGSNPPDQFLYIRNPGGGTLSWTINHSATWLSFSPSNGSFAGPWVGITVSVNVTGLPSAYFNAPVTISAPGANNSPQTIQVYLTITNPTPTPTATPTVTPTPTPTAYGGGGGGSSQPSISLQFIVNLMGQETEWRSSSDGKVLEDITAIAEDGSIVLEILKDTIALNADHLPLREISITRLTTFPDPPPGYSVVSAFEFEPDGASFSPALTVRVKIDPGMLPSGFTGSSLVAAYFNDETGEWGFISGLYDAETQEFTFTISHFTIYAVLMPSGATSTATPTPEPALVEGTLLTGLWVALGVILIGFCFLLIWRRRKKNQT